MRVIRFPTTGALIVLAALLPLAASGCGGDGGGFLRIMKTEVTILGCDATTYASSGVVCVDFSLTGPPGVFDLLAQFSVGPSGPLEAAYEVPPGLASQLGIVTSVQGFVLKDSGDTVTGRFCWWAGADLGFIAAAGVQILLTPVDGGTQEVAGPAETCSVDYGGGGSNQAVLPTFSGGGRAGHCAANVGGKSVVIAGGYAASATPFDTMDRFTFDTATFTYTAGPALPMQSPRAGQACSFFLDPLTQAIKLLVTGGVDSLTSPNVVSTADVYCFSPTEMVSPTFGAMNVARRGHSATWVPDNRVIVIGGFDGTSALASIEAYDPLVGTFQPLGLGLSFPRMGHTATLLPGGKILVAGGYDPSNAVPLPAEIVSPATGGAMALSGPVVDRFRHTATRLANGWVLLAGGLQVGLGAVSSSSHIFQPELGAMGEFTSVMPLMTSPRADHAATLLGSGQALITGGDTIPGLLGTTQSAEVFLSDTLTFTPTIPMLVPRAEHSSTATSCGAIALIGGRNDVGAVTNFLGSIELFPTENANPVVAGASSSASPAAGTLFIHVSVTDADADGGYLIIRFRTAGGNFQLCTIDEQQPSTAGGTFPNMQVSGLPSPATPYSFRWSFLADGLASGQSVEIEVLPIGATLGAAVRFDATLP